MESNAKALRKLSRKGWKSGKKYKDQSNSVIRNTITFFNESMLIFEGMEAIDRLVGINTKNKTPSKFKNKELKRLMDQIKHALKLAQIYRVPIDQLPTVDRGDFCNSLNQSAYQKFKKAVLELPKYLEKEEVPNKIKKQIREILEKV